mmetsp:Transcript_12216/g.26290  ORF Transcript_12216/g.26290 Transcript_12216/m.26290 type:complete len:577 (-) Transcript_12216:557-2287(-)
MHAQLTRSATGVPNQATVSGASIGARQMFGRVASRGQFASGSSAVALALLRRAGSKGLTQCAPFPRVSTNRHYCVASASASDSAGNDPQRVVIMGGGFGGLYTAIRLSSLFWPKGKKPQITLVDQAERFTFKPLLYELLNGSATEEEVAPSFTQLLAPYPIRFLQAKAVAVEPESPLSDGGSSQGGRVQLEGGSSLEYDWLVVALGSATDSKGVPGAKELAIPFNTHEDATRVLEAIRGIEAQASPSSKVMVVGAGYAGVELASVLAERLYGRAQVQLVTPRDDILDTSPEGQRLAARRVLAQLGVEIITGSKVCALRKPSPLETFGSSQEAAAPSASSSQVGQLPSSCVVELQAADGSRQQAACELVMWTAGSSPATKVERRGFPFPTTQAGSILTDSTLRVQKHMRVFSLGDVSGPVPSSSEAPYGSGGPLPATAQVAFQQADYAAWNLWAAMNGRPLLPFRYQHLGNMMALGQLNAAVALPIPVPIPIKSAVQSTPLGALLDFAGVKLEGSDAESGVTLEGPLAAAVRRAAYLYRQPTNEQRINVAASWLQQAAGIAANVAAGGPSARGGTQP